jgi:hypothetical protein
MRTLLFSLALAILALATARPFSTPQGEDLFLEITGRITNGDKKLPGCEVIVYEGNEIVGRQLSDKGGRFALGLGLGKEFALVFQKEGFITKRMLVDTRAKIPKEVIGIAPIDMELGMMPLARYEGADTDIFDLPFALVKWDKRAMAFVQDQEYTAAMQRANGAALLQAGRAAKQQSAAPAR